MRNGEAPHLSVGIVCYPSFGGSGVVAAETAVGLAQRGHRVHLIASAPPGRALPPCEQLSFHRIEAAEYPLFDQPEYALAVASAIVAVASEHGLDLVQTHYAVPHATSAYLARQMLGGAAPRFVATLHGTDVTKVGAHPSYQAVTRFAVAAADAVTVPSQFLRREAHRLLGLPEELPIEMIPNFVDTDRFSPASRQDRACFDEMFAGNAGGPVLFHVSNFRAIKRIGDLLEVLARVRRSLPARLVLVGDGPERAGAIQHAAELGVQDSVRFLGRRADFAELLRHADAFLLASESESFGVAALEALSSGVPVCGYRVGGLPEVVAADCGRLVEPFDLGALAGAVVEVLADATLRDNLGRAARARALAHFRRDPALDRYEACFRRVLDRGEKEVG